MKKQSIKERIKALNAKQKRKFKTALIMSLVCVVLLSGATFAWFTISNTAKVNNLKLTVVSEGALKIGEGMDVLETGDIKLDLRMAAAKELFPCTTTDGITMMKPNYTTGNHVGSVSVITDKEKYYYEKVFYIGVKDNVVGSNYDITLARQDNTSGSYVINKDESSPKKSEACIRISFEAVKTSDSSSIGTAIYEPNSNVNLHSDKTAGTDYATYDSSIKGYTGSNLHKQNSTGEFSGETGTVYYAGDSSALFTIPANEAVKITMRVWFEGTDPDCINDIQDGSIEGQFTFVSHKKETT